MTPRESSATSALKRKRLASSSAIAAKLRRDGDTDGAERNFERANALAPNDWTVRRASQPLRGINPFGDAFMEIYTEFNEAGRPYHGVTGH